VRCALSLMVDAPGREPLYNSAADRLKLLETDMEVVLGIEIVLTFALLVGHLATVVRDRMERS